MDKRVTITVKGGSEKTMGSRAIYTQTQLQEAFGKVKNRENWKYPVDATVWIKDQAALELIVESIGYMAGSCADCEALQSNEKQGTQYRIRADGYYIDIGA